MLKMSPISVSDRPRESARRTVTGISRPVGSQRNAIRMRNRRRAERAPRTLIAVLRPREDVEVDLDGLRIGISGCATIAIHQVRELSLEFGQPGRGDAHRVVADAPVTSCHSSGQKCRACRAMPRSAR